MIILCEVRQLAISMSRVTSPYVLILSAVNDDRETVVFFIWSVRPSESTKDFAASDTELPVSMKNVAFLSLHLPRTIICFVVLEQVVSICCLLEGWAVAAFAQPFSSLKEPYNS